MPTTKKSSISTETKFETSKNLETGVKSELPSISTLFQDAWVLFKKSWTSMLGMGFYSLFGVLIALFISGIIIFQSGINIQFFQSLSKNDFSVLSNPSIFVGLGLGILVYFILAMILQYSYYAGTTLILDYNNKNADKLSISTAIKMSFKFILPFFVISIISGLIAIGGLMFLFIPAIIFGLLFSFSIYELVIEKKTILESLKGSYRIVSSNFGAVIIRMLAIYVVYFIITFFIPDLLRSIGESAGLLNFIYAITVNIAMGWYLPIYIYCLYDQAKKATDQSKKVNITWVFVLTILGWLLLFSTISNIKKLVESDEFRKAFSEEFAKNFDSLKNESEEKMSTSSYIYDENSEVQDALTTSNNYFQDMIKIQNDANSQPEMIKINDKNISLLQETIKKFPENAQLWYQLSSACTWNNTSGTLEKGLEAALKAEELDPENQAIVTQVGLFYSRLNMNEKAILQLNKAVRIDDKNPATYEFLGDAYSNMKIFDKAKTNYNQALELFSTMNNNGTYDARILAIEARLARI